MILRLWVPLQGAPNLKVTQRLKVMEFPFEAQNMLGPPPFQGLGILYDSPNHQLSLMGNLRRFDHLIGLTICRLAVTQMHQGSCIQGRISLQLLPRKSCETNSLASFRHTDLGFLLLALLLVCCFLFLLQRRRQTARVTEEKSFKEGHRRHQDSYFRRGEDMFQR